MRIVFSVPGPPVGWQRAGVNRRSGIHYTQDKTRYAEQEIAIRYRSVARGWKWAPKTPLAIMVFALFPVPKSATKAERAAMIERRVLPTVKVDWDNCGKLVGDALNGVAYDDDKDIVMGTVYKMYSENPRTVVMIRDGFDMTLYYPPREGRYEWAE